MKKLSISIALVLVSIFTNGQVGINTTTPESTFDVRAKNHLGTVSSTDGILVPRVSALTVNGSVNGQLVFLINNSGSFTKGFYYWNGTAWTAISSLSGDTTNDAWINDDANGIIKLGTLSNGTTVRTSGTDFIVKDNGAIGIGTSTPDASAILDISASSKGVLPPRISLSSSTDASTIPSPATGLTVYNVGNSVLSSGLYTNTGTPSSPNWSNNSGSGNSASTGVGVTKQRLVPVSPSVIITSYDGNYSFRYNGTNINSYWQIRSNKSVNQDITVFIVEHWSGGGYDARVGSQTLTPGVWTNFSAASWVGGTNEINIHRIYDLTSGTFYSFEGNLLFSSSILKEVMMVEEY